MSDPAIKKTTKVLILLAALAIATVVVSIFVMKSDKRTDGPVEINPAFGNYVSAFTSGIISSESKVRIRLTEDVKTDFNPDEAIDLDLFDFEPSLKGEAYWIDAKTIEFRPEENMKSGEIYNVEFGLGKVTEVSKELRKFPFQFQIIRQSFEVNFSGVKTYEKKDLSRQKILGNVVSADVIGEEIEKVLSAKQDGKDLTLNWSHSSDRKNHDFTVEEVARGGESSEVLLKWNGEPLGIDLSGADTVEIPSLSDFKVIQTKVIQQPDQYISIVFSDPLQEKQNLNGLIRIGGGSSLKFTVEGNEVKAYPSSRQGGTRTLYVDQGVRNVLGYKMKEGLETQLVFENIKPKIELLGTGVILPNTEDGLLMPFKAVNIRAVRVKIVKIFESNVAQFLQVNRLGGEQEIKRVGRVVFNQKIALTSTKTIDYGRWNNFSLDLSEYINAEPGAIYKVFLSFKKSESIYPCAEDEGGDGNMEEVEEDWDESESQDESYWGSYEDYYYYDDYSWSERENPCHNTYYYGKNTTVSRNVLASDIGIIAKRGNNKEMWFAVSDLRTTLPMANVELEVLNYQQQVINSVKTDASGIAKIPVKSKPYLLVAKSGKQRGYLKLDDGSSLSLSKFDVSGKVVQKGIKGFLYGERGVWRPGDSLYLAFILEDKAGALPTNHPVNFELKNPQGQVIEQKTLTKGVGGFYNFSTATSSDAPTGNWNASIKVGGATFSKIIKIETVKPNRLKIKLDFGVEKLSVEKKDVKGVMEVKWLHGAIAKNLRSTIYATLSPMSTSFKRYKDYTFDDPSRSFYPEDIDVFDGSVDEAGKADIYADLEVSNQSPGMLRAKFDVKVFEESGDFSIDQFSIPYAPYESFVGIKLPKGDKTRNMLLTDKDHAVEVVTVDPEGNPVARKNLKAFLYKVRWRWWWETSANNDLSNYNGSSYNELLQESTFSTNSKGEGTFNIKVEYPDWGRYLVKVEDPNSGHATGRTCYIDWPGWAGRPVKDNPGGASMLNFEPDKKSYTVGEKATIEIPSGSEGRALVSIESGSKVIQAEWVEITQGKKLHTFEITKDMAPNCYVNITLVQPHNQTKNDHPIRLYGVRPIKVEDPETHITPVLEMPNVLAPEKSVTIKVSEKDGKPMTYTIAMVDEGLLDLTRFRTPQPWNTFYAREALGVKTWDMYDDVMGAFSGEMAALLKVGGDGEYGDKDKGSKANRFKPMVKFFGPYELGVGDSKTITFNMPKYIGSVRTMVIAGSKGAYGSAEKTTAVKQPLMVLATLPRVVGPGEQVKLPVTVFAMDDKVKNVTVTVKPNEFLNLVGGKSKTLTFSEQGDETINFDISVAEKLGVGKVTIIAKSGKHTASYDIELDVRNPNPPIVTVVDTIIESGQTWNGNYALAGMKGTNEVKLEVSAIPSINLDSRLKYLVQYPHGCIEQTTSSVFPQLYMPDLLDVNAKMTGRIKTNIKAGINRLKLFQTNEGGFGYWPGDNSASEWGSNYAGHFMLEAKGRGYSVPSGMLKNWKKYQKKRAKNWRRNSSGYNRDDFMQAYRLYTLALANSPDLASMNRLREQRSLSEAAKWRLAAAYQLAGQKEVAEELMNKSSKTVKKYQELSYTYGSTERDMAMILETLTLMNRRADGKDVLVNISKALSSKQWMSTQTTAYCLLAVGKYVGSDNKDKTIQFNYSVNGGGSTKVNTQVPISQSDLPIKNKNNAIKMKNTSGGPLFVKVVSSGIPLKGEEDSYENDLRMIVRYKDLKGNTIDPARIQQGTDFKVEVEIKNPGYRGEYKEMALTQIFPSGWEIRNMRLNGGGSSPHFRDIPTYQDIRDDRVMSYFNLRNGYTKTYVILLNATYEGKYYLPAVSCEAMYDNTITARKQGMWVEVVPQE